MRKKLLALLMCATMVLGTGVTAFADTKSDAEKVYGENAVNFMAEYWKADEAITGSASNGSNGVVTYGYVDGNDNDSVGYQYTPVVVYKNSKSATGYSQATKLTAAYDSKKKAYAIADIGSVSATTTIASLNAGLVGKTVYTGLGTDGKVDTDTAVEVKAATVVPTTSAVLYDSDANQIVDLANYAAVSSNAAAAAKAAKIKGASATLADGDVYAVSVMNTTGDTDVVLVTTTGATPVTTFESTKLVDGTNKYVQKSVTDKLVVAKKNGILKSTNENNAVIWSTVSTVDLKNNLTDVMAALDNKTFTKDAVAVKVSAYVQFPYQTETLDLEDSAEAFKGKAPILFDATKIQGGDYTFDSDLISRTGFKDAEAVDVFNMSAVQQSFDQNYGMVAPFNKVATVAVDKTIGFSNGSAYTTGVFVFDKGELAEEPTTEGADATTAANNDGVSDANAPKTTATSPETGDVAPIAALAVVMMGACGAMVVASKKRA